MEWKARLQGHSLDLESLTERFSGGPVRVFSDDGGHYLGADAFQGLSDASAVKTEGDRLLPTVNGVARTLDPSYMPVRLTGSFTDDHGRTHHFAEATGEARTRDSAIAVIVDEPPPPPPPAPGPRYVELAQRTPNVADATRLLGWQALDWTLLYKIYEILRDDVGGAQAVKDKGWIRPDELDAFTASANRPDISGEEARHARMGGGPPKTTMTLGDARGFIPRLVRAWMDSLLRGV